LDVAHDEKTPSSIVSTGWVIPAARYPMRRFPEKGLIWPDTPAEGGKSMNGQPGVASVGLRGAAIVAAAIGATAVGAFAIGALAVGALAIGRLAIRNAVIDGAELKSLRIDNLAVGQLRVAGLTVSDSLKLPEGSLERRS